MYLQSDKRGNSPAAKVMNWLRRGKKAEPQQTDRALLIFSDTGSVMQAEQLLKEEGYDIRVVSPPPHYRTGCDLSVEFPLVEEVGIRRVLEDVGLSPLDVLCVSDEEMEPLRLVRVHDYGRYLMVRAANMKLTVDKETRVIVNISGGGCADVPYLAREMIGLKVEDSPEPVRIGFSLCAYSLNTAREEMLRLLG
jgi:hypothetical protein